MFQVEKLEILHKKCYLICTNTEHALWQEFFFMRRIINILDPLPGLRLIFRNGALLRQLVRRNIISKYQGSALGIFWNAVHPLMRLCIYTFVFSVVFKARWGTDTSATREFFAVNLFCGMTIYSIFSDAVNMSAVQITLNPNYVKKVVFPLPLLPLSQVISSFIQGLVWILLLFIGATVFCSSLSWTMLFLPLILLPLFLFTLGISYFLSSLTVYLRDTPYILGVILQVLFFATPIFYPVEQVPEKFRTVLQINPLTIMIEESRKVMLLSQTPDWKFFGISLAVGIVVFLLGFAWFNKTQKGFADVL